MQPPVLESSLQRLNAALARMEDAVERRLEAAQGLAGRDIELQAVQGDRARLAGELDAALARIHRLEGTNREVSQRLAATMDQIGSVLRAGMARARR